jgi:hypothetical protein
VPGRARELDSPRASRDRLGRHPTSHSRLLTIFSLLTSGLCYVSGEKIVQFDVELVRLSGGVLRVAKYVLLATFPRLPSLDLLSHLLLSATLPLNFAEHPD